MAEKRLIDAKKYEESILLIMRCWKISPLLSPEEARKAIGNLQTALQVLKDEPTVDAVEVVRCKDCKYQTVMWCWREEENRNPCRVGSNDFCSYGKSRTEVRNEFA